MLDEKEFPQWIGCVALKELRQGLRRGLFTIPFGVVHIVAIVAVLMDAFIGKAVPYFEISAFINPLMFFPVMGNPYSCGVLWAVIPATCILIIPFIGISMMSQELQKGNNELLMLTSLKRDRVVIEKFLAAWSLCLLMLVSLLPYTLVPYWLNGMRIFVIIEMIGSIMLHSAVMCALVIAVSGYTRIPFRILFFILFGTVALTCLGMSFFQSQLSDGLFWHYLNAFIGSFALILFGLASAKCQLKITLFFYEMKPTSTVCLLLFFSPAVAGVTGAMTLGHLPALGFLGMAVLCWYVDEPTRSKKEAAKKKLNLPEGAELLG